MGLPGWCNITVWVFVNVFATFGLKEWKTYITVSQIVETKSGKLLTFEKKQEGTFLFYNI